MRNNHVCETIYERLAALEIDWTADQCRGWIKRLRQTTRKSRMLMTILGLPLSLLQGIWPCTGNCTEPQWCMTLLSDNGDLITPMLQAPPEESKQPDKEQEVTLELRPVTKEPMVLEQLQHIVCPYSEDLFGDTLWSSTLQNWHQNKCRSLG
ncbi:hypothetical protein G0U57_013499 [Chelydra serpentina]|uniref:Uncharacterized protein n=1 Tax=Chelydra serpentina TaxID=8475 RepID=A0A8T1SAN9_CHESE|nr:hypothetical protein G0U57_013499 [Chelydra serpentina]